MRRIVCWVALVTSCYASGVQAASALTPSSTVRVQATNPVTGEVRMVSIDRNLLLASSETGSTTTPTNVSAQGNLAVSGTANHCWRYTKYWVGYDRVGMEMMRLTASRYWCGDWLSLYYKGVTRADKMTAQPLLKGVGNAWEWQGLVDSNTDLIGYYYSYPGNPLDHAGHAQYVTGIFRLCISIPIVGHFCPDVAYPHIWINVHGDGAVAAGANNGGLQQ